MHLHGRSKNSIFGLPMLWNIFLTYFQENCFLYYHKASFRKKQTGPSERTPRKKLFLCVSIIIFHITEEIAVATFSSRQTMPPLSLSVRYCVKPFIKILCLSAVRPMKMDIKGVVGHVIQGSKVLLQCEVQGARPPANVTWYNGTEILDRNSSRLDMYDVSLNENVSIYAITRNIIEAIAFYHLVRYQYSTRINYSGARGVAITKFEYLCCVKA